MKAHVSTMLTDSGLSIALRVCDFKGLARRNEGCKTTSPLFQGLSVWKTQTRVEPGARQSRNGATPKPGSWHLIASSRKAIIWRAAIDDAVYRSSAGSWVKWRKTLATLHAEPAVTCYSSNQQPLQWPPPLLPPRPLRC